MSWKYSKAVRQGNTIRVLLKKGRNIQELTWSFNPEDDLTQEEFLAMVKREVKYYLDHLNKPGAEEDLTATLKP